MKQKGKKLYIYIYENYIYIYKCMYQSSALLGQDSQTRLWAGPVQDKFRRLSITSDQRSIVLDQLRIANCSAEQRAISTIWESKSSL